MRQSPRGQPLPLVAFLVRIDGTIGTTDYYPLDTPCEVLPLTATAADLGIKSASGHRSTRRATQSEAAASSFEVQRLLERAIEIKQGGSNE